MCKKFILIFVIVMANSIFSQDLMPSKELQGKWNNKKFEIEVGENTLIIKNKKSPKVKDIILSFLEIPKINKPNEFESWGCTGIFNASAVKEGNVEVKQDMNEFIYFRLKFKNEKLIFDFSNSLYAEIFSGEHLIVPEGIKITYEKFGFFSGTMKLTK